MARTLRRPMFRIGGMAHEQRTGYMGGGMSGIMSGITPRQPDAGLTPRMGLQEGSPDYVPKPANTKEYRDYLENQMYPKNLIGYASRGIGNVNDALFNYGARPLANIAQFIGTTKPNYVDETNYADSSVDAVLKAKGLLDEDGPNVSEKSTATTGDGRNPFGYKDDKTVNNGEITGDMETDLMKAYKEYAPIFEKELGVSDEDTKKSLYMNLAKFGAGILAQPGGDLVGAIGKAAEKPLEGAGETVKEQSTAKRQAKLLALQTAIKENEGGPLDKTLKSIAKAQGYKGKDKLKLAYEDYKNLQTNNNTSKAADTKRYAESATALGLKFSNQERYISESRNLPNEYPELIGRFNELLPEELDEDNVGGYYVSPKGQFVRVVEEDGEVVTIAMGEPGFKDKPKKEKK